MARETKVGLIVGLGVILFVSIFVSDYLSQPESDETLHGVASLNFVEQTTNQTAFTLVREEDTGPTGPMTSRDLRNLAAVGLEAIEDIHGAPASITPPPFREAGQSLTHPINDSTPLAQAPASQSAAPIGDAIPIDDSHLVRDHQLDVRPTGPGIDTLSDTIRIKIPDPTSPAPQSLTRKHTVKPGETLTAIARQHYDGDGNLWRSIRDANPGKVGANGEIVQGVVLIIPKRSIQAQGSVGELTQLETGHRDRPHRQRVRMVTVKEGQTLSELAAEHLGAAGKWQMIMDVNTDKMNDPRQLRAGMKLRIPAEPDVEPTEEANLALRDRESPEGTAETVTRLDQGKTYTVKENDSLYRIAQKQLGAGDRYNDIYEINKDKLKSPDAIRVGMKLKLPAR